MLETTTLGQTGKSISRLGLGCWAFGGHGWGKVRDKDSIGALKYALDNGITHFDTADVYGFGKSEQIIRQALGEDRKRVVIASKGGVRWESADKIWKDCSPAYLRQAVEASLVRLGLDCIPLYYIHWPDGQTPVDEAVGCLQQLKDEGKIGAIGLSNFSCGQIEEALAQAPVQSVQVQLNLFQRDKALRLLDICSRNHITMVAWGGAVRWSVDREVQPPDQIWFR